MYVQQAQCSRSEVHKSSVYDSSPSCSVLSPSSSVTLGEFTSLSYHIGVCKTEMGISFYCRLNELASVQRLASAHSAFTSVKYWWSGWGPRWVRSKGRSGCSVRPSKILSWKQEWLPSPPFWWEAEKWLEGQLWHEPVWPLLPSFRGSAWTPPPRAWVLSLPLSYNPSGLLHCKEE